MRLHYLLGPLPIDPRHPDLTEPPHNPRSRSTWIGGVNGYTEQDLDRLPGREKQSEKYFEHRWYRTGWTISDNQLLLTSIKREQRETMGLDFDKQIDLDAPIDLVGLLDLPAQEGTFNLPVPAYWINDDLCVRAGQSVAGTYEFVRIITLLHGIVEFDTGWKQSPQWASRCQADRETYARWRRRWVLERLLEFHMQEIRAEQPDLGEADALFLAGRKGNITNTGGYAAQLASGWVLYGGAGNSKAQLDAQYRFLTELARRALLRRPAPSVLVPPAIALRGEDQWAKAAEDERGRGGFALSRIGLLVDFAGQIDDVLVAIARSDLVKELDARWRDLEMFQSARQNLPFVAQMSGTNVAATNAWCQREYRGRPTFAYAASTNSLRVRFAEQADADHFCTRWVALKPHRVSDD